jgi:hypothetical protein
MVTLSGNPGSRNANPKPSGRKNEDAFTLALAVGFSVPKAAERAGISTTAAYARMNDPAFREQVRRARDDILAQAVGKLADAACEAVDTLRQQLADEDRGLAQRAANMLLTHMMRGVELLDLSSRVAALEDGRT